MSLTSENRSSHEINREKVCAVCGGKIVFKNQNQNYYFITKKIDLQIKNLVDAQFSVRDPRFPKSICATCRITLSEHSRSIFSRPLPPVCTEFQRIILKKETRANNRMKCDNCFICKTGSSKCHVDVKKGRGNKRFSSIQTGRNQEEITKKPNVSTICNRCYGKIGKGIRHPCTQKKRVIKVLENNVGKILTQLPENSKDRMVGGILKQKILNEKTNCPTKKNVDVSLSTMGNKLNLTVHPKKEKEPYFPLEFFYNYQANTGASRNHMKTIGNLLRCGAGRKAVPKDLLRQTSEQGKTLNKIYKVEKFELEVEKEKKDKEIVKDKSFVPKATRPVVYADATELLETIIRERGIVGNYLVKVMADSGQGFFKISMCVLPEDYLKSESEDFEETIDEAVSKRARYKDGGTSCKKAQLTSVKRLILLCVVPKIKESYFNLSLLFDLTQLNKIPFKFVSDFKLLLTVNGQQTATASFPCPFCFTSLNDLKYKENVESSLKTYGDLIKDYEKFCFLNKEKKKLPCVAVR